MFVLASPNGLFKATELPTKRCLYLFLIVYIVNFKLDEDFLNMESCCFFTYCIHINIFVELFFAIFHKRVN